jgi:Rrf2 family protein
MFFGTLLSSRAIFPRGYAMTKCNSSMQLTRAADYGVRVMVHLATLPAHERALLPALADATEAPESFLSKVLQALTRAELISSWRGKSGGFAILPLGRQASMREVIEAIDGPICLNVCLVTGKSCARKSWCPAHPVWMRAQQAMLDVLSKAQIAELASTATTVRFVATSTVFPFAELKVITSETPAGPSQRFCTSPKIPVDC